MAKFKHTERTRNFNSRPHGGRRIGGRLLRNHDISTHALTEGDQFRGVVPGRCGISTHALTEGDLTVEVIVAQIIHFNSRPHGGRLERVSGISVPPNISTHALTEGDPDSGTFPAHFCIFQLTPSRRATANLDKFFF